MRLYALNGLVGQEVLTSPGFVVINNTWASSVSSVNGGFAPQLNTTLRIDNGDARILGLIFRNGSLWATQTAFLPAALATHSAAQWCQINPVSLSVQQFGRVEDPSATFNSGTFFAYPSIAVNTFNDVLLGFSFFGPLIYASSGYAFRYGSDGINMLQCVTTLRDGLDVYTKDFGSGRIRWGDYSSTVVDPNGTDFWTLQESADTKGGLNTRWSTWWGNIMPR